MGIPVISELFSFLQSLVQSMPKAMKYILFLFFLIVMLWMMPILLHLFGFHCYHDKTVMSTPAYNFIGNMEIAFANPNEVYNQSKFTPKISVWNIGSDTTTILTRYIDDSTREECLLSNKTDCSYGLIYKSGFLTNTPSCINCTNFTCGQVAMLAGFTETTCLCLSDAVAKSKDELGVIKMTLTCNEKLNSNFAVPPLGYAYNYTDNTFTCIVQTICGASSPRVRYTINEMLDEQGAKAYYPPNLKREDINSTILIKCNNDYQPEITIFGIPIFSLQLWLGFFILGLLFFFLSKIRRH